MQRVTLIDNYDSFTFNLVHYLGELGAEVSVWRNDEITVADTLAAKPDAIVLSPGPCTPNEAGVCLDLVRCASETTPMVPTAKTNPLNNCQRLNPSMRTPPMFYGDRIGQLNLNNYDCRTIDGA